MPELPEVENVRISLEGLGSIGQRFKRVELLRPDLRVPMPKKISQRLQGQSLIAIKRRAKYLLFETNDFCLLNHLGMTGSWRRFQHAEKHDHIILHFDSGLKLVFNDPRRFGVLDLFKKSEAAKNRWLKHLGVEPLSAEFTADLLFEKTRKSKISIKGFLMDQRRIVGVGNIYASEALFAARIKPTRSAGRLHLAEAQALVDHIRKILRQAIAAGGSTISDYRNSHGEEGQFQSQFQVYDRAQKPCAQCGSPIRSRIISGRNTYWCAQCQR